MARGCIHPRSRSKPALPRPSGKSHTSHSRGLLPGSPRPDPRCRTWGCGVEAALLPGGGGEPMRPCELSPPLGTRGPVEQTSHSCSQEVSTNTGSPLLCRRGHGCGGQPARGPHGTCVGMPGRKQTRGGSLGGGTQEVDETSWSVVGRRRVRPTSSNASDGGSTCFRTQGGVRRIKRTAAGPSASGGPCGRERPRVPAAGRGL